MASNTTDIRSFLKGLKLADARIRRALVSGFDQFGAHCGGDAQDRAPIDKGILRASETELPTESTATGFTKVIGFNTSYAAAVHENLTAHHPQGEAKYLENAMRHNAPKLVPFLAGKVDKALQGGTK
jgi:hypothetical protein